MAGKGIRTYKFSELALKAKHRAIEDFRKSESVFDDLDARDLTDEFRSILAEDYGLEGIEVYWSLSYSQGDGVCFEGAIDLEEFVEKTKSIRDYGLVIPYATAKIVNRGHYCHSKSMTLDFEVGRVPLEDFLENPVREEYEKWHDENRRIVRANQEAQYLYRHSISESQKAYQEAHKAWMDRRGSGVKAWIPDPPPERPPKGEETPSKPPDIIPDIPLPDHLALAIEAAEARAKWVEEELSVELETYVKDTIADISKRLEEYGYNEIEYKSNEEYIMTELTENPSYDDREYYEDGSLVK